MKKTSLIIMVALAAMLAQRVYAQSSIEISKDQFGNKWPLSLERGIVKCLPLGSGAVVIEAGGETYAVNGTAKGMAMKQGFLRVDEIWLDDPEFFEAAKEIAGAQNKPVEEIVKAIGPSTKIDIGPILNTGLKLCR